MDEDVRETGDGALPLGCQRLEPQLLDRPPADRAHERRESESNEGVGERLARDLEAVVDPPNGPPEGAGKASKSVAEILPVNTSYRRRFCAVSSHSIEEGPRWPET